MTGPERPDEMWGVGNLGGGGILCQNPVKSEESSLNTRLKG